MSEPGVAATPERTSATRQKHAVAIASHPGPLDPESLDPESLDPGSLGEEPAPCSSRMTMEAWAALRSEALRNGTSRHEAPGHEAPGHEASGHEAPRHDATIPDECERMRLIGDLTRLLHEPMVPESTRTAGLTLIGWLARRMPGEAPHALGAPCLHKVSARPHSPEGPGAEPSSGPRRLVRKR